MPEMKKEKAAFKVPAAYQAAPLFISKKPYIIQIHHHNEAETLLNVCMYEFFGRVVPTVSCHGNA